MMLVGRNRLTYYSGFMMADPIGKWKWKWKWKVGRWLVESLIQGVRWWWWWWWMIISFLFFSFLFFSFLFVEDKARRYRAWKLNVASQKSEVRSQKSEVQS